MAKKSKGEIHVDLYSECYARLMEDARNGNFEEAMSAAVESLEYVPLVMNYLGKNVGEIPRFESIDFILKYGPLFLHQQSLDSLFAFLKSKRSVVQKLPHDVFAELELACSQLVDAHRAWNYLVTRDSVSHDELCAALGEPHDRWAWVTTNWQELGLLLCDAKSSEKKWRLVGSFAQKVCGKCSRCGAMGTGGLYKLLEELTCPRCKAASSFVIVSLHA